MTLSCLVIRWFLFRANPTVPHHALLPLQVICAASLSSGLYRISCELDEFRAVWQGVEWPQLAWLTFVLLKLWDFV